MTRHLLYELSYTNCQGDGPATKCTKIVVLRCQIGRTSSMTQYIIILVDGVVLDSVGSVVWMNLYHTLYIP